MAERIRVRELEAERSDVVIKSGGDTVIRAVADYVVALRPAMRTIREEAPRASIESSGSVERAIQSVTWRTGRVTRSRMSIQCCHG